MQQVLGPDPAPQAEDEHHDMEPLWIEISPKAREQGSPALAQLAPSLAQRLSIHGPLEEESKGSATGAPPPLPLAHPGAAAVADAGLHRLSADAAIWQEGPPPPLPFAQDDMAAVFKQAPREDIESTALWPQPLVPLAPAEVHDVFKYVEMSLASFPNMVIRTEVQKYNRGASVRVFVTKDVLTRRHLSDLLLGTAQQALLQVAAGFSEVFLLSCENNPFTPTGCGNSPSFGAALVKVKDPSTMCWATVKQGFCACPSKCVKEHPDVSEHVELKVMLRRARFGEKYQQQPRTSVGDTLWWQSW